MTLSVGAFGDRFFAGELGAPVSARRSGRIVFSIRAIERAVEHVVGREMQQGNAELGRGFGHMPRPFAVETGCDCLLRLSFVHRRIGGGVDDHVRPRLFEPGKYGVAVGEVEPRTAEGDDFSRGPARSSSDVATWPFIR